MDLNVILTFCDVTRNEGLFYYLDFIDACHITQCSKYLHNSILLPAISSYSISSKKTFNDALNFIIKKGHCLKSLTLPYNISTNLNIDVIMKYCPYITKLSLSCVVLCYDFKQGLDITESYVDIHWGLKASDSSGMTTIKPTPIQCMHAYIRIVSMINYFHKYLLSLIYNFLRRKIKFTMLKVIQNNNFHIII